MAPSSGATFGYPQTSVSSASSAGSAVSSNERRSWAISVDAHSPKLTVIAASPSGCRHARYTLTVGDVSSAGSTAVSAAAPRLASTTFHWRSITTPGYGSWASSMRCRAARTMVIAGASIDAFE